MAHPPGVGVAQLPNTRPYGDQESRIEADKRRAYEIVTVTILARPLLASLSNPVRDSLKQGFPGDNLTLLELIGANSVGVRLGKGRKFMPVSEGDTIKRDFQDFTVRHFGPVSKGNLVAIAWPDFPFEDVIATFLVSYGEAIVKPAKRPGFSAGFYTWKGLATAAGVNIADSLRDLTNYQTDLSTPTLGKHGGTILIRNLDLAASLFLYNGANVFDPAGVTEPSPASAFEIRAGETLSLNLKGRHTKMRLASLAGTVAFNIMADSAPDLSDLTLARTDYA